MQKNPIKFYLKTFCKRLNVEKELALSWLKLLEAEEYIMVKYIDGNHYRIAINKPIKTNSCIN